MKKVKLFPKTFLYVFSLMAAIALISHILFYFMMPVVYASQKEAQFQDTKERLIEILKDTPANKMEEAVWQHAIQYQMGVFVNCDGVTYNLTAGGAAAEDSGHSLQENVDSHWLFSNDGQDTDFSYLQYDFYTKTDSQIYSGTRFDTAEGKTCYLLLLATLQPVSEAKQAALILLPFTLLISLLLSVLFALLYSGKITKPLSDISELTERMKRLDPLAVCPVETRDEIGVLSDNINALYQSLLTTIDRLQKENVRVSEAERQKVDFLRAASHELKTPVTALQCMLDNMIMGIGRYGDWEIYLPVCRDMVRKFGAMIQEILDASRLNFSSEEKTPEKVAMRDFVEKVLSPYTLIAKSKDVQIDTDFSADFSANFSANAMEKALSNILSNAVKYTNPFGKVRVYFSRKTLIIENECDPVPANVLPHIFEPFYRPDFSRSRNLNAENPDGGNGLGLYITAGILNALSCRFSFEPFDGSNGKDSRGMRFSVFFS